MSTLRVEFPRLWPGWHTPEFILYESPSSSASPSPSPSPSLSPSSSCSSSPCSSASTSPTSGSSPAPSSASEGDEDADGDEDEDEELVSRTRTRSHACDHSSSPGCSPPPPPLPPTRPLITVTVDTESPPDYGSDTPVFRGYMTMTMTPPSSSSSSSSSSSAPPIIIAPTPKANQNQIEYNEGKAVAVAVVLKFALRPDLIPDLVAEAAMYDGALRSLQGRVIPRCYGLFEGVQVDPALSLDQQGAFTFEGGGGEEGEGIACLVLERWGECLSKPFRCLALPLRLRILHQLLEIHALGLWHGDFAERNVLEKDGDVRLIDFDQVVPHDSCSPESLEWLRRMIECLLPTGNPKKNHHLNLNLNLNTTDKLSSLRIPAPPAADAHEFGCDELWEVCRQALKLWD